MDIKKKVITGFGVLSLVLLLTQGITFFGLRQTVNAPLWLVPLIAIGTLAVLGTMALVAVLLLREISRSKRQLCEQVDALLQGNLSFSSAEHCFDESVCKIADLREQLARYFKTLFQIFDPSTSGTPLQTDAQYPGDYRRIAEALRKNVEQNHQITAQLQSRAEEQSTELRALLQSAALLTDHTREQSYEVQEFAQNLSRVAALTRGDAENAARVKEISNQASVAMEQSEQKMDEMTESMNRIAQSSEEIGKVLKIIEDITFQTNILALNAAVEAARAGEAGKGFAVVADEVRRLAAKSSEAAGEIARIVLRSKQLVSQGNETALLTANSLKQVGAQVDSMSAALQNIDSSTSEQASAFARMEEIVDSLNKQIEQVVMTLRETAPTARAR